MIEQITAAYADLRSRRRTLLAMVNSSGWGWEPVLTPKGGRTTL